MLNMDFASFLTVLVISLIAGLVMHYAIHYRVLDGADGFLCKWVVGWVGALLGTPVLGHWFQDLTSPRLWEVSSVPSSPVRRGKRRQWPTEWARRAAVLITDDAKKQYEFLLTQ